MENRQLHKTKSKRFSQNLGKCHSEGTRIPIPQETTPLSPRPRIRRRRPRRMSSLVPPSHPLLENDSHSTPEFPNSSGDSSSHGTTAERCPLQARQWSGSDALRTSDIGRFQQENTASAPTILPSSQVLESRIHPTQTEIDTDLYLDISISSSSDPRVTAHSIDTGDTKRTPAPATTPFPIKNIQIPSNTTQFHAAQIPVSQCSHAETTRRPAPKPVHRSSCSVFWTVRSRSQSVI
jgi:hypothetical protein